jgi:hypothetical protein
LSTRYTSVLARSPMTEATTRTKASRRRIVISVYS